MEESTLTHYKITYADGRTESVFAQAYRRRKPRYEFYTISVKNGRMVEEQVLGVFIDDVKKIETD